MAPHLSTGYCASCNTLLEFAPESEGCTVACPVCNDLTILSTAASENPDQDAAKNFSERQDELLQSFHGKVRGPGTSIFYQMGLLAVALTMLTLPLLYLCMIAAAGYGVFTWAKLLPLFLSGPNFGSIIVAKLAIYIAPLFAGSTLLFFMIKPLFAPKAPHSQPLALNPESEPILFAFVHRICQVIGAPLPARIDINCELNASASFRRGFKSFFSNDLVLTLGLPLAAGTNVSQLAGVIAHEFGHFTQGFGMRLQYIIRRVNHWFARVIYERDQWDLMLAEWVENADDWRVAIVGWCAQAAVGLSRILLKLLYFTGVGISSFMSRQMEYDADAYEIELVGSRVFEETTILFGTLGAATSLSYKRARVSWNNSRALPDSFPEFMVLHHQRMPKETRTSITDQVGLERAGLFSTHPASGDRIRCARQAQKQGVFSYDPPATSLFGDFEVISKQVTMLHYSEDMGLPLELVTFRPSASFFETPKTPDASETESEAKLLLEKQHGPPRLKLKSDTQTA